MNDRHSNISTSDNTMPVTEEEFKEGMWISLMIGLYYTFNAFFPIIIWYGWRRVNILAMDSNTFYKMAWYTMYPLHFFVFLPMALVWPMTYTGISAVVEVYDLANWYLGSITAGIVYVSVTFIWMLAAIFYSDTESIS